MRFIYGSRDAIEEQERLCAFVGKRTGEWVNPEMSVGIGVICEHGVGVVLYDSHTPEVDMQMHVAGEGNWLNRAALAEFFGYPFQRAGVRRVTGIVDAKNKAARKFNERLGFKREGLVRQAMANGHNAVIYGMLKDECRWLREPENGQEIAIAATAA